MGEYTIRSLYFDDWADKCFYENLNGTDPREKFRIRIYNADKSYIMLEEKQKSHGKTRKLSCRLSYDICQCILDGKAPDIKLIDSPVYQKFCMLQYTNFFVPKVIVEYERIPYVYRDGNVRITFDMNIRSGNYINEFFDSSIASRPIMKTDQHVLEVKFDEYLPDFIYSAIQKEQLQQTAFSKYYLCRKYNQRGYRI